MMKKWSLVAFLTLIPMVATPASWSKSAASVTIGERELFTIKAPAGGLNPEERAEIIQRNIDNALMALAGKETPVEVLNVRGMYVVTLGGYYIGSVDDGTATTMGLSKEAAAQSWARSIRDALVDRGLVQEAIHSLTTQVRTLAAVVEPDAGETKLIRIDEGLQLPIELETAIDANVLHDGDVVEARLSRDIALADGRKLSTGTVVRGTVQLNRNVGNGVMQISFDQMQLTNGTILPIRTAIVGGISDEQRAHLYSPDSELSYSALVLPLGPSMHFPTGQKLILELRTPAQFAGSGTVF